MTIGLFNDSFPPLIDGVANATENYAKIIQQKYGEAIVAAPYYPNARDNYPFEVVRYPSMDFESSIGYRAGYPFDQNLLNELEKRDIDIIHSHCPFASTVLARLLRNRTGVPIVFTYHTKFDIEFEKNIANEAVRKAAAKFIVNNVEACDDVWAVSEGAGQSLRALGYTGEYTVVENGTDFDRRRSDKKRVGKLRKELDIPDSATVFLYVGRMRWYKGIKLSIDGLKAAKAQGEKFRFILVGEGADSEEIKKYAEQAELKNECIFAGGVYDREKLRDFYTMSDIFLFPSDFDTDGIVVREAAACGLPSVLIENSCAAKDADGTAALLIDGTVEAMRGAVLFACAKKRELRVIGENASQKMYRSWDEAVAKAWHRYKKVLGMYVNNKIDNTSIEEIFSDTIEKLTY